MNRPVHSSLLDSDGLQADVMRFLAIIAFCLIAVMALIPELPEQDTNQTTEQLPSTQVVIAKAPPIPPVETTPLTEQIELVQETRVSKPQPPKPEVVSEPEQIDTPPVQAPLSLRFSSEQDFLSLLGSGRITLYAKSSKSFVRLNRDFSVSPVSLTGELYELLPSSLPTKILKVMQRQNAAELFLVALPETTADQISSLSQRHNQSGGALLIDHEGKVHHESAI